MRSGLAMEGLLLHLLPRRMYKTPLFGSQWHLLQLEAVDLLPLPPNVLRQTMQVQT